MRRSDLDPLCRDSGRVCGLEFLSPDHVRGRGGGEESIRRQACHDEGFYVTTGMGIPTHGHRKPFLGRNALFAEQSRYAGLRTRALDHRPDVAITSLSLCSPYCIGTDAA